MLGIVPDFDKININSIMGQSSDDENSNETKTGFLQRLKSFRRSTLRRTQGREKRNSTSSIINHSSFRDKLPAKFIQTTDVKKSTLNPKWMEKFRLYVY